MVHFSVEIYKRSGSIDQFVGQMDRPSISLNSIKSERDTFQLAFYEVKPKRASPPASSPNHNQEASYVSLYRN